MRAFFVLLALLLASFFCFSSVNQTYATDIIKVKVTEKIPWANCTWSGSDYTCDVEKWFWTVKWVMWAMIKYFTFIAWLLGILFIVVYGIMMSMWGLEESLKSDAKKKIVMTIIGLIVLLLSWVILNSVAPWVYTGT